jgi:hypothetical protein
MNTSKSVRDNCYRTKISWLKGRMLTARSFPVIVMSNNAISNPSSFVLTSNNRNSINGICENVLCNPRVLGWQKGIGGTSEKIIRYVLKMSSVVVPRASRRDMIGCTFPFNFQQNRELKSLILLPFTKRLELLKSF